VSAEFKPASGAPSLAAEASALLTSELIEWAGCRCSVRRAAKRFCVRVGRGPRNNESLWGLRDTER